MYKQYKLGHYLVLHTSFCNYVFTVSILHWSQPAVFESSSDLDATSSHPTYMYVISKVRRNSRWEKPTTKQVKYTCAWIQNIKQIMRDVFINGYIQLSKRLHAMSQKMEICKMWIDQYFYSCKELKLGFSKSSLVFWKMHSRNNLEEVIEIIKGWEEL